MFKILVEGKKDECFIKTLIKYQFAKQEDQFEIIATGGWMKLPVPKVREFNDKGHKVLVIFDDDTKPEGGFDKRLNDILKKKEENRLAFEIFLFPDNKSDGDFELLLEKIVNDEHKDILNCFQNYEDCIKSLGKKQNFTYQLPIRKSKIYAYVDSFQKSREKMEKFKKGDYCFDNDSIWNLKSANLEPLINFINNTIKHPNK